MEIRSAKEPRFLLMYAPQRFNLNFGAVKPEASLGNLYLAAALRDAGFQVNILDCCLGNERYSLEQSFYRQTPLPNGMIRIGMAPEDIIREVAGYDVIGVSSIFTPQTYMVEELVKLVSHAYSDKLIIMGGINARTQMKRFFDAGAHLICLSEAERTIIEIGNILREGRRDFSDVFGVAFMRDGRIQFNPTGHIEDNLDLLPIPARDLLPLDRIWEIARPHGGVLTVGQLEKPMPYVSAMTSRGCPYVCTFCHISGEQKGANTGYIGKFRFHSEQRVEREMISIQKLGAEDIYIEDDSLLAKKKRALNIFKMLIKFGFNLGDVNGINLSH